MQRSGQAATVDDAESFLAPPGAAPSPSRQMALIGQFGVLALPEGDLDAVLRGACRIAAEGMGAGFARVLRYQPGEHLFLVSAAHGWHSADDGLASVPADAQTTAGFAWHTGQPVHSDNPMWHGRFRVSQALTGHGVHRSLSVPIPGTGVGAYGVLEVGSRAAGEFGPHDASFLQALAGSIAAAVERRADRVERDEGNALAAQRAVMLRELRHRLGNDLHGIGSLARLEARRVADPAGKAGLERVVRYVSALSGLYRHLADDPASADIDLGSYLGALCADLAEIEDLRARRVTLEVDLAPLTLASDRAMRLAVVVNELFSNAVKHAFREDEGGTVTVRLRTGGAGGRAVLSVADDGRGFAGPRPGSSGLDLVGRLVQSAGGTLGRSDDGGTCWRIAFDASRPAT